MSIKAEQLIKSYKIMWKIIQDNLFLFSLQAIEAFLEHSYGGPFLRKKLTAKIR